jgi:hypothetical protein
MLTNHNNFGTDPDNSVVYSRGFTIVHNNNATPGANLLNNNDIFIPTYNYTSMNSAAQGRYIDFMNDGGVIISFLESTSNLTSVRDFARAVIPNGSAITTAMVGSTGGAYRISNVNDVVINGPFGDVRNLIWGEDRAGTIRVANLPANGEVTVYSVANNLKSTQNNPNDAVLFKSNTVPWIYCGDGGYFASGSGTGQRPFALDSNRRPISKDYGNFNANKGTGTVVVHNSALFGNMMLWAISQIDYDKKVWNDR